MSTEHGGRGMRVDQEAISHLLRLKSSATNYNLWEKGGREKSALHLSQGFMSFLKIMNPSCFVEAGANDGLISVSAKMLLPECAVHAFEANPYNFSKYSKNPDFYRLGIRYNHTALSDKGGTVTFNVRAAYGDEKYPLVNERSSIHETVDEKFHYEKVTVCSTTMDAYFEAMPSHRYALWVDVEGASREVLSGSSKVLTLTDLIMIEVEDTEKWKGQWVAYDVVSHLLKFDLFPIARDFEYRNQYNIVFASYKAILNPELMASIDYHNSTRVKS